MTLAGGHNTLLSTSVAVRFASLAVSLSLILPLPAFAQHRARSAAPYYPLRSAYAGSQHPMGPQNPGRFGQGPQNHPGQQHLPEWLQNHQNLSPQQQEDALRREPGFNRLPPGQQQRLIDRLHTLDSRPPAQRARILQRMENMERLSPEQRAEVRGAAQALTQMNPYRQRMVKRAFQDLRELPPEQRQSVLNSQRFAGEFSPQERTVLGNLLTVEPYQPRNPGLPPPSYGK